MLCKYIYVYTLSRDTKLVNIGVAEEIKRGFHIKLDSGMSLHIIPNNTAAPQLIFLTFYLVNIERSVGLIKYLQCIGVYSAFKLVAMMIHRQYFHSKLCCFRYIFF